MTTDHIHFVIEHNYVTAIGTNPSHVSVEGCCNEFYYRYDDLSIGRSPPNYRLPFRGKKEERGTTSKTCMC